jgi:hypothetical protein
MEQLKRLDAETLAPGCWWISNQQFCQLQVMAVQAFPEQAAWAAGGAPKFALHLLHMHAVRRDPSCQGGGPLFRGRV